MSAKRMIRMTTIIVIPMPIDMLANRLVSILNWLAVTMSPRLMACRVYKKSKESMLFASLSSYTSCWWLNKGFQLPDSKKWSPIFFFLLRHAKINILYIYYNFLILIQKHIISFTCKVVFISMNYTHLETNRISFTHSVSKIPQPLIQHLRNFAKFTQH